MCRYALVTLFLLLTDFCYAQDSTSKWVWIKGDVTIPEYAIYGQRGIPSKNNTPGPRFDGCKWADKNGSLWVFGGQSMDEFQNRLVLNDLWQYDPSSDEWTWISGDSTSYSPPVYGLKGVPANENNPGSLEGAAYWADKDGNFWLYQNNLWKYNPLTHQWAWMNGDSGIANIAPVYITLGLPDIKNTPGTCLNATSWTDKDGNFWIYGNSPLRTRNALWKYDLSVNMWACVKEDSLSIHPAYGSKGVAGPLNTPNPRNNSTSFTDNNGNLWLFGGYIDHGLRWPSGFYNDLWKYNIQSNQWTWVNGDSIIDVASQVGPRGIPSTLNKPGGNTAGNAWVDPSGNFWLQGGSGNFNTPQTLLWKYDPSSNLWTWISSGLSVYGEQGKAALKNYPGARYAGLTWTDPSGNFWLFGGNRNNSYISVGFYFVGDLFNDLWKYDLSTGIWTWMKGGNSGDHSVQYGKKGVPDAANSPGPRGGSGSWIDASDNLWLFGGGSESQNDFWKYSPVSNTWTWMMGDSTSATGTGVFGIQGVPAPGNIPPMRSDGYAWKDNNGNFWMYGGLSAQPSLNSLNDLWKYNPSTGMWAWMNGEKTVDALPVYGTKGQPATANTPGGRFGGAVWTDKSGNFWLFGGNNSYLPGALTKGFLNDLWKYDVASNEWTWVNGEDTGFAIGHYGKKGVASLVNRPGARYNSAYWTSPDGNFWLFGGQVSVMEPTGGLWGAVDLDDIWKYDPKLNEWTWMQGDTTVFVNGVYKPVTPILGQRGKENSMNTPGVVTFTNGGSWTDKNGSFWLFDAGILWRYNRKSNSWSWIDGDTSFNSISSYGAQGIYSANNYLGARSSSLSWTDSKDNFWLYSGVAIEKNIPVNFSDLWRFTPLLTLEAIDSTAGDTTLLTGSIKVFPNPFRNIISVTSSQADSVAFIKAYSISGLLLMQLSTRSLKTDIDMSYYLAGVYVIIAEDKNHKKMGVKKIVKQ